ncbi:hypothetical protein HNV11_12715 [Spirosoma taeanense]|uniref:Cupin type-2 domain-containing protein n=1 Tax=Spirosoma taeanense TaxID=2735870 RepID=A0A6M5Y894_9BACT|nr:cupin domain-containing protein [Spirosoma taeanense]QJW90175.1 hypothetical protein HNV11_12715 [Spirosoma taeanense]
MKTKKEDIPVTMEAPGTTMRALPGYGGMTVAFNELPAGTDFSPLLAGLPNNSCHCPHWGYVVEGALKLKYDDGTEETVTTGDVFYLPPGHTAIVEKDLKFIDFSPEKELNEVMGHIAKKMTEFSS